VYLVSRAGVTGVQETVSSAVKPLVAAMRGVTELPLVVGFGISKPEQVAEAAQGADGVVVGSALVRMVGELGEAAELEERLEEFTRGLKTALEGVKQ
jgi:tryptophan synthase alpha chain